ncbi:hypothetical protein CALCODRAFT_441411 [Calocera cornea HHB12733]|uniref:S1 motif domain-containing protein n=1 Tax=Calocera cornea HHB12733 TaxID=1353952 RepID=A0A165DD26_9BASI|nr:hypothetical protein CALCODRAFT_441411 [Calocera cornea HHB12733]
MQKKSKPATTEPAPGAGAQGKKSLLVADDIDFPRGGGTELTAHEVREARQEAKLEMKAEAQKEKESASARKKRRLSGKAAKENKGETSGTRVEQLNYKRLQVGTKLFGRIAAIHPLHLVLSLPDQLAGYVPITHITSQLTALLEKEDATPSASSSAEDEDEDEDAVGLPELGSMFSVGQYVRASVTVVRSAAARGTALDLGKPRNDMEAMARRVELTLVPEVVNEGVVVKDIVPGFMLSGAIKGIEDHGYSVDLGLPAVSGFLPFSSTPTPTTRLPIGHLLTSTVSSLSENRRLCTLTALPEKSHDALGEVSNVASVLPGTLVRGLITATTPAGLNLQILGFFDGTIEPTHLPKAPEAYKVGSKLLSRVLWHMPGSSPPKFALSAMPHVVKLEAPTVEGRDLQEVYTYGMIVHKVKVMRVEAEWGLSVELEDGTRGFVHIGQVADEHIPALSPHSGPWKLGTTHEARVLGFYALDGLLQLSLKPSILERRFLQTGDFLPGEIVRGTIQRLTDVGMFVDVGGNVSGRVAPDQLADIALKHPEKRYKPGGSVKCRILAVDPEHGKLTLTCKKSLLNSDLPIIAKLEDAKPDMIADAVVFKLLASGALIMFYGGVKGFIPLREASDTYVKSMDEVLKTGQSVKVKVLSLNAEEGNILASVRQAQSGYRPAVPDVEDIAIGSTVEGEIKEVQAVNVVLSLQPRGQTALVSLANLASRRNTTVDSLRMSLVPATTLSDLVVVSKNPEKRIVIVAARAGGKGTSTTGGVSWKTLTAGQIVPGQVVGEKNGSTSVRLSQSVIGRLHLLDLTDNLDTGIVFPRVGSALKVAVVGVDAAARTIDLSTRPSRLNPESHPPVVDPEIPSLENLKVDDKVRGIVKNISDSGLFVSLGRNITARVQIKELFDEFVKDWQPRFSVNQVVKGKITQIDPVKGRVEMSLRSGTRPAKHSGAAEASNLKHLGDFEPGQKVTGKVTGIAEFGIFIRIDDSNVSGLCHHSELSDSKKGDVQAALKGFRIGDVVKAVILSIDSDKKKVSFGLKPSYFTAEDYEMEDAPADGVDEEEEGADEEDEAEEADVAEPDDAGEEVDQADGDDADALGFGGFDESEAGDSEDDVRIDAPPPTLKLSGGFQWSNAAADEDEDEDMGSELSEAEGGPSESQPKKKKKKGPHIEQDLTLSMQERAPESVADFERLLLGSPNSSFLWIQFMSFYLQLSEIDKAREIARRALNVISFREEQEKLNVWIALLNLENTAGTDESLEKVFQEAARANDSKTMHLRLATIFDECRKPEKAEEMHKRAIKKFSGSSKVWTLFGQHYMSHGKLEEARELLPRSLKSLEKRKHIKTILKFAHMEYELGDPERGKTLLEAIVDSHAKRLDLWFVYVDMETKQGDLQAARKLFDRMLALKLKTFKAKSVFKKWLELEKRLGDEEGQERVKARAVEWMQNNS